MNLLIFVIFPLIIYSNATLLFWSNKNIRIPSLKFFTEKDFENLLGILENPQILAFRNDYDRISNIPPRLGDFYTAYVSNGNMPLRNVTGLSGDVDDNLKLINESMFNLTSSNKNMLIVISSPNIRSKRSTMINTRSNYTKPNEQVLYYNNDIGSGIAMIYSSKFVLLKTPADNYTLKQTRKTTLTNFASYSVLAATFPLEKLSITLKFRFQRSWGYWSLPTVQVDGIDAKSIILNSTKIIRAESNFSYHCVGKTVFKNGNIELILYDIQVQPYSRIRKFSEAYDCIPFTTVPIWSGLMVSFTLIFGLFLGFGALASIKTMDKFDTSRSKQLSFTVSE